MNKRVLCYVLGRLAAAEAAVFTLPMLYAFYCGEDYVTLFLTILVTAVVACELLYRGGTKGDGDITSREGIAITGLGWLLGTFFGMLPYVLGGYLGLIDGVFESISGFTGTGATVFNEIETLPKSILFWRSLTNWFGGLGIIVIFIALIPQTGASTVHMYNAALDSASDERIMPRLKEMTKVLFGMYSVLTILASVIYFLAGLDVFSAVNHAMTTIATGGYSTYRGSIMDAESLYVEFWMMLFMFISGANFSLYYRAAKKGLRVFWRDGEFRAYTYMFLGATFLIALDLFTEGQAELFTAIRYAAFQASSFFNTGFVSVDFNAWPGFSQGILLLLMISGGCAGSTASGLKIMRVLVMLKAAAAVIKQKVHPRQVSEVKLNGVKLSDEAVFRVGQFFFLYIFFLGAGALLLALDGFPVYEAITLSISTMGNIGTAFGAVGEMGSYGDFSVFTKCLLCFIMLLGRLEMFALLVLLRPSFWRQRNTW